MNAPFRNEPTPAPRVQLEPDVRKIVSAIAFLIQEGERRGLTLTQYDIVKSLFMADKSHLNKYGRLITHDNYIAMNHGPVPSLAYDMLKLNKPMLAKRGVTDLPWSRTEANHLGFGCFKYTDARLENEGTLFSPSDLESLKAALSTVKSLTFKQIRELTHGDEAYKEAWALVEGDAKSAPMSLGLLYDVPNFEAAEEVEFISQQISQNKSVEDELDSLLSTIETG